jgi:hypothetical protein
VLIKGLTDFFNRLFDVQLFVSKRKVHMLPNHAVFQCFSVLAPQYFSTSVPQYLSTSVPHCLVFPSSVLRRLPNILNRLNIVRTVGPAP